MEYCANPLEARPCIILCLCIGPSFCRLVRYCSTESWRQQLWLVRRYGCIQPGYIALSPIKENYTRCMACVSLDQDWSAHCASVAGCRAVRCTVIALSHSLQICWKMWCNIQASAFTASINILNKNTKLALIGQSAALAATLLAMVLYIT